MGFDVKLICHSIDVNINRYNQLIRLNEIKSNF